MENSTPIKVMNNIHALSIAALNVNSLVSNIKRAGLLQCLNKHCPDILLTLAIKAILASEMTGLRIYPKCLAQAISLETTCIKIKLPDNHNLYVIAAYSTGNCKKEFIPELESLLDELNLENQKNYYILAGDLNCRHPDWGNSGYNPRASATFPNNNSFLDICLIDKRIKHRFNFYKADRESFQKSINSKIIDVKIPHNRNLNNEEIENNLKTPEKIILDSIEESVPKCKKFNSAERFLNKKINKLQKHKSFLITEIHKLKAINPGTKCLKLKKVNRLFRRKRSAPIDSLKIPPNKLKIMENANLNPNEFRKDNTNNLLVINPKDKLDIIRSHFELANNQNEHLGKPEHKSLIENKINDLKLEIESDIQENRTVVKFDNNLKSSNPIECPIQDYFTNENELRHLLLKKINNKKSAGLDGIPNTILKNIPNKLIKLYAIIFNKALNNMYFPQQWKLAKVIALHKKGKDGSDPSSYRPISLLPNISKICEIFIYNAILHHCNKNKIIPEQQFGFRHKHSTIYAINKFTSDICWNINGGSCVGAVFIDLEKTFDTVWLDGLFFKLLQKKFPSHLIKIIWSMVHNKSFIVSDRKECSNKAFNVANGLQQGTVNSPLLFNIYTSDLLNLFGLNVDPEKKAVAFADDLLVYISGEKCTTINDSLQ
ncbi:uncharacterized protein LOC135171576 [Diachasmimorpha longicaudata]|uniref:uncharacterized protein LOC135171576 n=1 Tax=Diachasmimorpha longicaudata TaxID=58733 RepID=UPI0030B87FBC